MPADVEALHTRTDDALSTLSAIWPAALLSWRRWAIHKAVDRAIATGLTQWWPDFDVLVSTTLAGRHVWLPDQAAVLVAAGFLIDDGPVERDGSNARWYRPAPQEDVGRATRQPS